MPRAPDDLDRGRRSYSASAWRDAYERLAAADAATGPGPDELELLARAAYMLGRAADVWLGLRAPFETARARALVGPACRSLDDEDGAVLEPSESSNEGGVRCTWWSCTSSATRPRPLRAAKGLS